MVRLVFCLQCTILGLVEFLYVMWCPQFIFFTVFVFGFAFIGAVFERIQNLELEKSKNKLKTCLKGLEESLKSLRQTF